MTGTVCAQKLYKSSRPPSGDKHRVYKYEHRQLCFTDISKYKYPTTTAGGHSFQDGVRRQSLQVNVSVTL